MKKGAHNVRPENLFLFQMLTERTQGTPLLSTISFYNLNAQFVQPENRQSNQKH